MALFIEDLVWSLRCRVGYWLHGPYGLACVIEKIPFRFLIKYLRKYGAQIGEECRFERGLNIHRPMGKNPFENLVIGDGVYLGHKTLIDLTRKVEIKDKVIIASYCQIWTHVSQYHKPGQTDPEYDENYGDVIVGEGVIIYSGTIVQHGTEIGAFARVGASSLVNRTVEPGVFVGGVPAKPIHKTGNFND